MSEFTKGEWSYKNWAQLIYVIGAPDKYKQIAAVSCALQNGGKEMDANGYLIAAAPELLKVCQDLIDSVDNYGAEGNAHAKLYEQAKIAVAKAKGE